MTNQRHIFEICVAVRSPFSFSDVDATGMGIDTPALRNHANVALLPASHLKGLLREGFRALQQISPSSALKLEERTLFGEVAKSTLVPVRGALHFADLAQQGDVHLDKSLTRIKIDEDTGTVATGMLQVVELAAPLDAVSLFKGEMIWHGGKAAAQELAKVLQKALRLVPYFGGMRSAGFGFHETSKSCLIWIDSEGLSKIEALDATATSLRVRGKFAGPIAIDVTQIADNVFLGGNVVPGSAIKGALADMLRHAFGKVLPAGFDEALSAMCISHAFPIAKVGKRGNLPVPLCFAQFGKEDFRNELGNDDAGFDTEKGLGAFLPDMKDVGFLRKNLARPEVHFKRFAYGHTAISADTGTAADSQLFVVIAQDAGDTEFEFTVVLPSLPSHLRDSAEKILSVLRAGIDSIGKTNARFRVSKIDKIPTVEIKPHQLPTIRVLLETPALFAIPDPATNIALEDLLKLYFKQLNLDLQDFYIQHDIRGGYTARRWGETNYQPVRLIRAGACFEFAASEAAFVALEKLAKTGLPVYEYDANRKFNPVIDWKKCVFLPENGYGEISVEPPELRIATLSGSAT